MSTKERKIFTFLKAIVYWLCKIFTNHKKPY